MYLIRFIEQANITSVPEFFYIIVETALAKFVRLNIFHAYDGLLHDTTVPISAITLFS